MFDGQTTHTLTANSVRPSSPVSPNRRPN